MAHRKWKETKKQPSMLPGPAVPGCSLVYFHFLWEILCPQAVVSIAYSDSFWWSQRGHYKRYALYQIHFNNVPSTAMTRHAN